MAPIHHGRSYHGPSHCGPDSSSPRPLTTGRDAVAKVQGYAQGQELTPAHRLDLRRRTAIGSRRAVCAGRQSCVCHLSSYMFQRACLSNLTTNKSLASTLAAHLTVSNLVSMCMSIHMSMTHQSHLILHLIPSQKETLEHWLTLQLPPLRTLPEPPPSPTSAAAPPPSAAAPFQICTRVCMWGWGDRDREGGERDG